MSTIADVVGRIELESVSGSGLASGPVGDAAQRCLSCPSAQVCDPRRRVPGPLWGCGRSSHALGVGACAVEGPGGLVRSRRRRVSWKRLARALLVRGAWHVVAVQQARPRAAADRVAVTATRLAAGRPGATATPCRERAVVPLLRATTAGRAVGAQMSARSRSPAALGGTSGRSAHRGPTPTGDLERAGPRAGHRAWRAGRDCPGPPAGAARRSPGPPDARVAALCA